MVVSFAEYLQFSWAMVQFFLLEFLPKSETAVGNNKVLSGAALKLSLCIFMNFSESFKITRFVFFLNKDNTAPLSFQESEQPDDKQWRFLLCQKSSVTLWS